VTTSPLVLFEVVFTLHSPRSYNHPKERVVALLSPLLDLRGFKVANKSQWRQAFQTWLQYPIDFTDAYNVAVMRAAGIKEIYAWDKGYSHVPDITRVEPGDALEPAA
jgi:predicted nucleic acid-binding protein